MQGWGEVGAHMSSWTDLWETRGCGGDRDVRKGSWQITETKLPAEDGEEQRSAHGLKAQGSERGGGARH